MTMTTTTNREGNVFKKYEFDDLAKDNLAGQQMLFREGSIIVLRQDNTPGVNIFVYLFDENLNLKQELVALDFANSGYFENNPTPEAEVYVIALYKLSLGIIGSYFEVPNL